MQYSMLIYLDEKRFGALSKEEQNRIHQECGAWHDELVKSGQSRSALALEGSHATRTLRSQDGHILVTDGPFAETKEVLGGLEILECEDLDEAIAIAKCFPGIRAGGFIELRPNMTGGECRA